MDKNNLEFDISSMSEFEYKLRELASLSGNEIDKLDNSHQVLFTCIRDDIEAYHNILAMAPMSWFSSEENFKERLKTDLSSYIREELQRIEEASFNLVGKLIDYMGVTSFESYVPWDLFGPCENDIENIEIEIPDDIQAQLYRAVNSFSVAATILNDPTNTALAELIDKSEINIGMMFVKVTEDDDEMEHQIPANMSPENIKESLLIRIRLDREYRENGSELYSSDVDDLYTQYIN